MNAQEINDASGYTVTSALTMTVVPALTAVGLSTTPVSPQDVTTPITLTATPQGGLNILYTFTSEYIDISGTDHLLTLSNASSSPICVWTPTTAANYTLTVTAREANKANVVQASTPYRIVPPVSAVALSVSPTSPMPVNSPLTLTATATGGTTDEYHFQASYQDAAGPHLLDLQAYSINNTCIFTPTIATAYQLIVYCKQVGDQTDEAQASVSYQIVTPLSGITLTPSAYTPMSVYNQVTFTAAAIGGTHVQYQFWCYNPANTPAWTELQAYSSAPSYRWTPTAPGNYLVSATARDGVTGTEANTIAWYQVGSGTPLAGDRDHESGPRPRRPTLTSPLPLPPSAAPTSSISSGCTTRMPCRPGASCRATRPAQRACGLPPPPAPI